MTPDIRAQIAGFGAELSPEMLGGTQGIYRALQPGLPPSAHVTRDINYGPDERNRLDIFARDGLERAPVLVFLHGGGFVMGDKTTPGSPFYDNIGGFAVDENYVGVTITYRLAPAHQWPSGPEDLGKAIAWLRENIAQYGGDPERIYVMGQSAGAMHVASYVAHEQYHVAPGGGIAGALIISAIYEPIAAKRPNPMHEAYYGSDYGRYEGFGCTKGLIETDIPLLMTVSEYDAADFLRSAAALVGAWGAERGDYPPMHYLRGHNHLSPVLEIGTPDSSLEHLILDFIGLEHHRHG